MTIRRKPPAASNATASRTRVLIALIVMAFCATALTALTVAVAPKAAASGNPIVGTRTIVARCDGTDYHAKAAYNFTISLLGTEPNSNPTKYLFRFQLNSAVYTGNAVAQGQVGPSQNRSPTLLIDGVGVIGAGVNGSGKPFPRYVTTTTGNMTNGINATYSSFDFQRIPAWNTPIGNDHNVLQTDFYYSWPGATDQCVQYFDLSQPSGMYEGSDFMEAECGTPGSPGYLHLDTDYEMIHVAGDNWKIHFISVHTETVRSGPTNTQPYQDFALYLDYYDPNGPGGGANLVQSSFIAPTGPGGNRPRKAIPDTATTVDWDPTNPLNASGWQDVNFPWIEGLSYPPIIKFDARRNDGGVDCVGSRTVLADFSQPGHTYTNTVDYQFDDCGPAGVQPAGRITLTSSWSWDANEELVRLNSVILENHSANKFTIPAPVGAAPPNAVFRTDALAPFVTYSTMNGGDGAAYRTWAAGETRAVDVTDPTKWTAQSSGLASSAPAAGSNMLYKPGIPVIEITGKSWRPNGALWTECNASRAGLAGMEATSLRL